LVAVAIGSGCGYSTSGLIRPEYRRVYLPLFQNETFWRDLEVSLTRQVQRELASRPGIFIVSRSEADIVLDGTIVDFRQRVLSEDARDAVRESSAVTRVRMEVRVAGSGRLLESYDVSDQAEFFVDRDEDLDSATEEMFFDLARKIVIGLEESFPPAKRVGPEPSLRKPASEEAPDA
jgi:hypothetical protein